MAMTLRLDPELDAKVAELARRERLSKQQFVIRTLADVVQHNAQLSRTMANVDRVIAENRGLLDRLRES